MASSTMSTRHITFKQDVNSEGAQVVDFYKGANVLITGASGFLGKVILRKLLDTCPDIGKIYVLIRAKNEQSGQKRLIGLLKGKPFCFKYDCNELIQKVVAIESDMTEPGLGLTQTDRSLLEEQVNVVIHSAASVKFDAPLKDNLRDNVYGPRSIVELCNRMTNIKALVHVSTAYSNCHLQDIGEELLPLETDIDKAVEVIEALSDENCKLLTHKLLEGRPNTYTYTKAIAEHYVARSEGKYPIAIVRPSIVISSFSEPVPGWVDNINGIAGFTCLAGIGLLRTIDWNYHGTSDMVPVDYVANCIICSAHQVYRDSPRKLKFYNMTSGNVQPISWGSFFEMTREDALARPTNKIVRPPIKPPRYNKANPLQLFATRCFSELLFAFFVDLLLAILGYKRLLMRMTRKMHQGAAMLQPFTKNQWSFKSNNVLDLADSLSSSEKNLFKFDMRNFNWREMSERNWNGSREYLLKEPSTEQSFITARKRQSVVNAIHYGIMGFLYVFTIYVGAKVLRVF